MPASKPAVRALSPALHYLGDPSGQPHVSGIPSRDLAPDDVSRVAQRLGLSVAAFVELATSRGVFSEAAPAKPAADESPSADGKE
jgi:hypothetical protein